MSFIQREFLVFFAVVLALVWAMPGGPERRRVGQNAVLLVASAVFYGWVDPWMLGLLAFSTGLDYGAALGMARWPGRRRLLLGLSLAGNLGLLGTFKYLGFFVDSVAAALEALGLQVHLPTLRLALPVGISFYTFQTLSYTLDVYRGRLAPRRSLLDFALFVSLFPQLVAGPVERARALLPQIEAPRVLRLHSVASGLSLALWGAVKKVVVADSAARYVDAVFALEAPPPAVLWAGALAFAVQILADFSGYTDIARGSARMLGFELSLNFLRPYAAASPSEFWRRWHVSFSSWIHEYVYAPLCGSAPTPGRRVAARFGALLLSGLWHGAAWHFVLWGLYHAVLLSLWRALGPRVPGPLRRRPLAVALMFSCTVAGWLIFRVESVSDLGAALAPPWVRWSSAWPVVYTLLSLSLAGGAVLALGGLVEQRLAPALARHPWRPAAELGWWALAALLIAVMARDTRYDFLYFRF